MNFTTGTYYTIPNSSIRILVLNVIDQTETTANLYVAYVSNQGHVLAFDSINFNKDKASHWETTNEVISCG